MAKAKRRLVDLVLAMPPAKSGYKTWFERTDPEIQAELELVRKEYHSNPGRYNKTQIYKAMADPDAVGLTVKRQAFIRWLDEKPNG